MKTLQKYIKESIQGYHLKKKSCSCGCNTCDDKPALLAPILNESLAPRAILSEGLKYHIDNNKPLTEHVYRAGSKNYFDLWAEARALYSRGIIDIKNQDDLEILTETQLGEFGLYEGKKVPLDFIMEEIELEEANKKNTHEITLTFENSKLLDRFKAIPTFSKMLAPNQMKSLNVGNNNLTINNVSLNGLERMESMGLYKISKKLEEADKKKKTPPIGKPKRGGSKKFYVYVRKPGGGIKKVSFGDTTGLSAKINNPEARRAFAKRHDCANKKDRTKASYWSCRLPRYAKLLGLKSNFSGFW
jgi:hypothetical protein